MDLAKARTASRARWFTIVTRHGEFDVFVEPFGNREWRRMYDRLAKPYRRHMRKNDGALPHDVADRISIECTAHTVLKDWRGVTDNGEPVPYSPEAGIAAMTDVDEIREGVSRAALELAEVYAAEQEDAEKNSRSGSAGNSSGALSSTIPAGLP